MPNQTHDLQLLLNQIAYLEKAHQKLQDQFQTLQQKLASSKETLELVITHLSDGLIFVTIEGKIALFNPAAAKLLKCSEKQVLHSPFWEHFQDALFGFSLTKALKNPQSSQRIILTLDEVYEIEVSATHVPDKGLLVLLHDRTELMQLESSLHQADRLKELGEMAATLAHEIRNPLGGIEGFAALLKEDLQEVSHSQMLTAILEGTKTLNHLVSNVLEYSRNLELHFVSTDLIELLQESMALLAASSDAKPCMLKTDFSHYKLFVDPHRIKLALLNLLKNAAESGTDQIEVFLTSGKLTIQDFGCGIAENVLDKIFTPFYTTKTHGTGLGLAEVQKMIHAHGWAIEVSSEREKGTTFTLNLPKPHDD